MIEIGSMEQKNGGNLDDKEYISLGYVDLLVVLARAKWRILGVTAVVIAGAVAYALLTPPVYQSRTTILPPQHAQSNSLLSQFGAVAGTLAGSSFKSSNELYLGMLRSRTVSENLIKRFDLKTIYETKYTDAATKELGARTTLTAGKDGLITIAVEDTDKQRAAKLAAGYVEELIALNQSFSVSEAGQRKIFYERQLAVARANLVKAESTLKQALNTSGVISVDSESRAIVEMIGGVRAQISAKEIQLNAMRASFTSENPDVKRVQHELNSLRTELGKLENGQQGAAAPLSAIGLENIQLLREVKYQQMLYELLVKQYEGARLDVSREVSLIQVLDPANIPERKLKPRRAFIVISAAIASLLVMLMYTFGHALVVRYLQTPDGMANLQKWRSRNR
jgi:uncharacterized protein involved in exopolysaccharide biosynthesis